MLIQRGGCPEPPALRPVISKCSSKKDKKRIEPVLASHFPEMGSTPKYRVGESEEMHNNCRLGMSCTLFKLAAQVRSTRTAWCCGQDTASLLDMTVKKYVVKLNSPDVFFAGHFAFLSIIVKQVLNSLAIIMKQLAVVTETCYINRYTTRH